MEHRPVREATAGPASSGEARTPEELAADCAVLQALVDSTEDLIWSVDARDFSMLSYNRGLAAYYARYRGLELYRGMPHEALVPEPELGAAWATMYRRALAEGACSTEYATADGRRTLDLRFRVLRDESGPFAIGVFGRDVTEERRARTELVASEERYRRLVEQVPLGIYRRHLAPDKGYVYMNRGHLAQFECATEEEFRARYDRVGQRWARPEDYDRFVARLRADGHVQGEEVEVVLVDGTRKWLALYAFLDEGDVISGFSLDLTAQKRAEAERARLLRELHQSQKLDAIGRLAGGVAHDFNNLLTVIQADASYGLDQSPESVPFRESLRTILEASERAAALTRQLLAFGRQQEMQPRRLQLNGVVRGFEKMLRRVLGEDVQLVTSLCAEDTTIVADPGQLEQVIMNLVINSRDAMPAGGTVTIETACVEVDRARGAALGLSPGLHVVLKVTDTGVGMDEQTRGRVFEPFFTTKGGQGNGLGLPTAYGIVKQSGGAISVESQPGAGTTFDIHLPRVEAEPEVRRAAAPEPLVLGSETILLVENDSSVRDVTRRALAACGYGVLVAGGAGEAILTCEQRGDSIDLLLTDLIMPQMSGKTLAERLTRVHPRMKVLFMSGLLGGAAPCPAIPAGASCLHKPFSVRTLAAAVRAALERPQPTT